MASRSLDHVIETEFSIGDSKTRTVEAPASSLLLTSETVTPPAGAAGGIRLSVHIVVRLLSDRLDGGVPGAWREIVPKVLISNARDVLRIIRDPRLERSITAPVGSAKRIGSRISGGEETDARRFLTPPGEPFIDGPVELTWKDSRARHDSFLVRILMHHEETGQAHSLHIAITTPLWGSPGQSEPGGFALGTLAFEAIDWSKTPLDH
jgi:hypothetical protein